MPRFLAGPLAAVMLFAACSEPPTASQTPSAASSLRLNQSGSAGATHSDSMVVGASISWTSGSQMYFVNYSEGLVNQVRSAMLGYSTYNTYPCWDWWQWQWTTCYDLLSFGWGYVPATDVRGGAAELAVATNTTPEANPEFAHYNDPGGEVSIQVVATPGAPWRVGQGSTHDLMRPARVRGGTIAGVAIPEGATAWIVQSSAHTVFRPGNTPGGQP